MPTTLPRRRPGDDRPGLFHAAVVSLCLLGLVANILLAAALPSEAAVVRLFGFG